MKQIENNNNFISFQEKQRILDSPVDDKLAWIRDFFDKLKLFMTYSNLDKSTISFKKMSWNSALDYEIEISYVKQLPSGDFPSSLDTFYLTIDLNTALKRLEINPVDDDAIAMCLNTPTPEFFSQFMMTPETKFKHFLKTTMHPGIYEYYKIHKKDL